MSRTVRFEQAKSTFRNWRIVRHSLGPEREVTRQREKAFVHFFNKRGEVEFYGDHQYLTDDNGNAIIRPDHSSPLAATLLDGLALILSDRDKDAAHPVVLNGIHAMRKTALLSADANAALGRSIVQPETQINHNLAAMSFNSMLRGDRVQREPGQLDGWFIGTAQVPTAVGSHVPVLLQPHEVVMTNVQPELQL